MRYVRPMEWGEEVASGGYEEGGNFSHMYLPGIDHFHVRVRNVVDEWCVVGETEARPTEGN